MADDNNLVPWNLRPEYLAYTDWTPVPGVTSYVYPRAGTGTDVTDFHPGQAYLSEQNLPDIMYHLHPCKEWSRFKNSSRPGPKQGPDGSPVYEQWARPGEQPRQLIDYKILPDKISSKEGWWYWEFVRRIDPRIKQVDIIMREGFSTKKWEKDDIRYADQCFNTPAYSHYRPTWKMLSWHAVAVDGNNHNQSTQYVLENLTDAQKQANTTRGSTPGLINPALGDIPSNRVPIPILKSEKRELERACGNTGLHKKKPNKTQQHSRGSSSYVAITPAPMASAAVGAPIQVLDDSAAEPVCDLPICTAEAARKAAEKSHEDDILRLRQIVHAMGVAQRTPPMPSDKQTKKRRERRPIKQVKSVHNANFRRDNGELYHDVAPYHFQPQRYDHSQPHGYSLQSQIRDESTMEGARLPQYSSIGDFDPKNSRNVYNEQIGGMIEQYPDQLAVPPFQSTFPNCQQPLETVASPYLPTSTAKEGALGYEPPMLQPEDLEGNLSYGEIQADPTLEAQYFGYSFTPNAKYVCPQSTILQPTSGADHGYHGGHTSWDPGFHPYAHTEIGNSQTMEPPQMQQHPGGSPLPPVSTAAIYSDDRYVPDMTPASLTYTSAPEYFPNDAWNWGIWSHHGSTSPKQSGSVPSQGCSGGLGE